MEGVGTTGHDALAFDAFVPDAGSEKKMPPSTSLLDQCFDEVLRLAPEFLGRCIDATVENLQEVENQGKEVALRDVAARAWWALLQSRSTITKTYPRRLKEAFNQGEQASGVSTLADLTDSSMLQLVDENVVNESLESARLLQSLLPMVEHSLAALDARMSSLIGFKTVKSDKNPLRPSVFVRVLRELMTDMEHDAEVRALWLQQVGPSLGRELNKLYGHVAMLLQKANVEEAGYRVRLVADPQASRPPAPPSRDMLNFDFGQSGVGSLGGRAVNPNDIGAYGPMGNDFGVQDTDYLNLPGGRGPGQGGGHGGTRGGVGGQGGHGGYGGSGGGFGSGVPAMADLAHAHSHVAPEVFQDFLHGGDVHFNQALTGDYYDQVQRDLHQLKAQASVPMLDDMVVEEERTQFRGLPAVDRPVRSVTVGTQLSQEQWGEFAAPVERSRVLLELKQKATRVAQAIGLDMVRKLVNQVARDPLLLAPVREAVVAMEPALLRMALDAPRYFDEEDHPARRLVETVAQRSFKYNDEFGEDFEQEFLDPVRDVVRDLNRREDSDPQPFADALVQLRQAWEDNDKAEKEAEEKRLKAIRHAEERQALADEIAWEMSMRPDVFNAPGVILDFLYQTWSLVIAEAKLVHDETQGTDEPDPGGYRKVISDLLWSTKKDVTLRRPKQLIEIIPGMLKKLRQGLDMLGKAADETKPFFDALLRLHEPVLGLRRAKARTDGTPSSGSPLIELPSGPGELDVTLPATPEQQKPRQAAQPWMGEREKASAGFEEVVLSERSPLTDSVSGALGAGVTDSTAAPLETPSEAAALDAMRDATDSASMELPSGFAPIQSEEQALVRGLRVDDWADVQSKGKWYRAKLVWVSSHRTLFMFTSRGGRAHSMTRRSLEKLLKSRQVRVVEAHQVVQRALEAVSTGAEPVPEDVPASVM